MASGIKELSAEKDRREQEKIKQQEKLASEATLGGIMDVAAEQTRHCQEELRKREKMALQQAISAKVKLSTMLDICPPAETADILERLRWSVLMVLVDTRFDALIGIVILVNSVTVGVQASYELQGKSVAVFDLLEHIFLAIYTVELSMRFFSLGWKCLYSGWVAFDFALVVLGILSTWVLVPILTAATKGEIEQIDGLAAIMVLRVLRILRLARSLRLVVQFHTLWMLVRGLLTSAGSIFYTFVLMILLLYVFACMGVELISKSEYLKENEATKAIVANQWSSLLTCMLTLVQFVTLDSVGGIYAPMIHADWFLTMYFMTFILIVSVTTMNLVTAVIVEGALALAKEDKEVKNAHEAKRVTALLPQLKEMFLELDEDGGGTLSLDEVENAPQEVQDQLAKIGGCDMSVMFELLDDDGSGEITVEDFCEGLLQMVSSDQSVEFIRMRKLLAHNKVKMDGVKQELSKIEEKADKLIETQAESFGNLKEVLSRIEAKMAHGRDRSKHRTLVVKSVSITPKQLLQ
eukprot:TRINITY_DN89978_c0_g1_i1.p1 TRINITY_DN89978_c0_g1~~TRINITY_DN89978_c0_g1_i1.p1  ORF type:complete len:522 (-),score=110.65 TRINITY_DN89978_c0_g1_i1:38-1603(-)